MAMHYGFTGGQRRAFSLLAVILILTPRTLEHASAEILEALSSRTQNTSAAALIFGLECGDAQLRADIFGVNALHHVLASIGLIFELLHRYSALHVEVCAQDTVAQALMARIFAGAPVSALFFDSARGEMRGHTGTRTLNDVVAEVTGEDVTVLNVGGLQGLWSGNEGSCGHFSTIRGAQGDRAACLNRNPSADVISEWLLWAGFSKEELYYVRAKVPLARMRIGLEDAFSSWRSDAREERLIQRAMRMRQEWKPDAFLVNEQQQGEEDGFALVMLCQAGTREVESAR